MKKEKNSHKKKIIGLTAVIMGLVVLSSVTSVPLIHGSTVLEDLEENPDFSNRSLFLSPEYLSRVTQGQYMTHLLTNQLIKTLFYQQSTLDVTKFQQAAKDIFLENLDTDTSIPLLQSNAALISTYIQEHSLNLSPKIHNLLSHLQGLVDYIHSLLTLTDGATRSSGSTPWMTNQNVIAQGLINLVLLIIMVILFLLDGGFIAIILGGASAILSGIIFILVAIASTLFLLLMGLQGILSLTAIFLFLLGIVSKVVITVLTTLGGPLIGLLAWKLANIIGSVLGYISLGVLSFAGIVLLLALPIGLGLIVVSFIGGNGGNNTTRLPLIVEHIFSVLLNIPGIDDSLQSLWMRLGERFDNWPEWPFDTPT